MMTDNKIPTYNLVVDRSKADRTTFTLVRDGKHIGKTQVTNVLVRDIIHNLYWDLIGNEK